MTEGIPPDLSPESGQVRPSSGAEKSLGAEGTELKWGHFSGTLNMKAHDSGPPTPALLSSETALPHWCL